MPDRRVDSNSERRIDLDSRSRIQQLEVRFRRTAITQWAAIVFLTIAFVLGVAALQHQRWVQTVSACELRNGQNQGTRDFVTDLAGDEPVSRPTLKALERRFPIEPSCEAYADDKVSNYLPPWDGWAPW